MHLVCSRSPGRTWVKVVQHLLLKSAHKNGGGGGPSVQCDRPHITGLVDWALKINYLSFYLYIVGPTEFHYNYLYFNHGNNHCLIISETIQAMPIKFAVKVIRLKVYMTIASPMTLTFSHGHKWVSNVTTL